MNKKALLSILLCSLSLSSCADTSELYQGGEYVSANFIENRYSVWPEALKKAAVSKTYNLSNDKDASARYFAGSDVQGRTCYGYGQLKERHPEAVILNGNTLDWTLSEDVVLSDGTVARKGLDIINRGVGVWYDQSPLENLLYGQNKKLSRINSAFSRGYLSKLYNGQIQCDAWSSYSLVELDKSGYGTFFPVELHSASYFAFSCRGGSDTPGSDLVDGKINDLGRLSRFDITVTFYKVSNKGGYEGTSFVLDGVPLETNISAEHTSLVGFYFNELGGESFNPSGVVGMSVTYSLEEDEIVYEGQSIHPSDDFDDGATYHTGLIMLEVFFPDSSWN